MDETTTPRDSGSSRTRGISPTPEPAEEPASVPAPEAETERSRGLRVGRRGLLGTAGAALLAGGAGGYGIAQATGAAAQPDLTARSYPFRGDHQQGIVTPAQDYMFAAAFDVTTSDPQALKTLMGKWCTAAEQMTAGELVGGEPLANVNAAPTDTGEAWGYPPSSLTIMVGVGPSLFVDPSGKDRFGLASKATTVLKQGMPRFANENLRSAQSYGDLIVEACADDAQVAVHAIRQFARIGMGTVAIRWTQIGQGRTSSTSKNQPTARNLFGFKDGTNNVKGQDGDEELAKHLWIQPADEGAAWLAGGTYLVTRKIRQFLETWDRLSLVEQENITGRDKRYGAPLSVTHPQDKDEFVTPDFKATKDGQLAIPNNSHVAVVSPDTNNGYRMLRRGYNYTEGSTSLGQIDGGLFFQAFVRDPTKGFYDILDKMTRTDQLSEYLQHVGSGLFAVLPGIAKGDTMFGQKLFG